MWPPNPAIEVSALDLAGAFEIIHKRMTKQIIGRLRR